MSKLIHRYAILAVIGFMVALSDSTANAQSSDQEVLASWVALDAPTGHEHLATDLIQSLFPSFNRDRSGNLVRTIGSGRPHRVITCGLDSYAYAVSQITDDGFLRLHRIGAGSSHPLWDQAHEGQHLRVLSRSGPLLGVSAIANGHFASQHADETAIITQDDLWLDVGATTAVEVAQMGIQLLDPVVRNLPPWSYANEIAGPRAGARVGCAAVVAAAEAGINGDEGSTSYVLSTQQIFGGVGAAAALRFMGPVDSLVLVGPGQMDSRNELATGVSTRFNSVLSAKDIQSVLMLAPKVQDADALMERVTLADAQQLLTSLVRSVSPVAAIPSWLAAPDNMVAGNADASRWGPHEDVSRLMSIESQLDQVAELSAVPGHEGPIRSVVYEGLPGWARESAQIDEMGNLWVEAGPPGEATVFVAHMDEVGYEVQSIDANGVVNLTRLGGAVDTAWEGQPAVLQLDPNSDRESLPSAPQVPGVFLVRRDARQKQPESVKAWFGMDGQQLATLGVRVGMGVTGYKEGHRMGQYRYASRSLDDRVGTTALLLALQKLDPQQLQHRVIFAWSVREEGGLRGSGELAKRFGMNSRRVYSIDTFVSSDTPLESPHFAFTPLGNGPVLRSIESAGMSTPYELQRNKNIAARANIAAQVGLTQGSTDGTGFTFFGAPNAGLSWPGRYSHTPAEIADLRDVAGLIDLIVAMAIAPPDTQ